jgi:hypothetical protein
VSILDLIAISSLSILLVFSFALLLASKLKQRKALEVMAQLIIDRTAMSEEINRLSYIVDNSSDLNDGFVKFLSESREEAFSYISEVQQALEYIKIAMELKDDVMISDAYNKLISFLPSDSADVVE